MSDFYALMQSVVESPPAEPTPLLVAADWCQENDKHAIEYALRWCAARKLRPFRRTDVVRRPWQWIIGSYRYRNLTRTQLRDRQYAILPRSVWMATPCSQGGTEWHDFPIGIDAFLALSTGLASLRTDLAYPDLPAEVKASAIMLVTCRECGIARSKQTDSCPVCKATEVLS